MAKLDDDALLAQCRVHLLAPFAGGAHDHRPDAVGRLAAALREQDGAGAAEGWLDPGRRRRRFAMHDDSDISTKPARAVSNAVIASVIGDTMNYVSGGEVDSHSGPPDGNPVAAIMERIREDDHAIQPITNGNASPTTIRNQKVASSARAMSRATITSSAELGMPLRPSRFDTQPSFMTPPADNSPTSQ